MSQCLNKSIVLPSIVFLLALSVRVTYILTVGRGYIPQYDSQQYYQLGMHLLQQHCFCLSPAQASVDRAPLWPAFIALIALLFGPDTLYPRLFLAVVSSASCVLVYLFARTLFGWRVALCSGIIAAFYTGMFIYDGWLYTESLYNFFLLAFAYALFVYQRSGRIIALSFAGICSALAALTRPNGFLLLGLVVVWGIVLFWTKVFAWKRALFATSVVVLIVCLLIAPWTARNYMVKGKFIPIATGGGVLFSGIYNDTTLRDDHKSGRGMWIGGSSIRPIIKNPHTEEGHLAAAKEWIINNSEKIPYLLTLHFLNTWLPYTSDEDLPFIQFPERFSSQLVRHMIWFISPVIFALAALGLIVTWKRWRQDLLVPYLIILTTIVSNVIIYGSMRFRSPIEPFLVLLVGGTCWWFYETFVSMRYRLQK